MKQIGGKRWVRVVGAFLVVAAAAAFAASSAVWRAGDGRLHSEIASVEPVRVALVLGCPPRVRGGGVNQYFVGRVEAAAGLFHRGKVEYLLVSGDNARRSYNEPQAMREALLDLGVPDQYIVPDFAGFSTLDSLIRAHEVFGQVELLVVSQEFHNRRALFLADGLGVSATAFNARDVERGLAARLRWREVAARWKAFADVYLFGLRAEVLGEPIEIGPPETHERHETASEQPV